MVLFFIVLLCSNVACVASEPLVEQRSYKFVDTFTRTMRWFQDVYQQWEHEDTEQLKETEGQHPRHLSVDYDNGIATGETKIKATQTTLVVDEKSRETLKFLSGIAVSTQVTLIDSGKSIVRKTALKSFANYLRKVQLSLKPTELLEHKTHSVFCSERYCVDDKAQGIRVCLLPPHVIANLKSLTVRYSDGVMLELQRVQGCKDLWESKYWKTKNQLK